MSKDEYCPEGHCATSVEHTTLFSGCVFCKTCDKVYQYELREVPKKWFGENYNSDRFNQIKDYAAFLEAKKKVNNDDLIRLGYLEDKG